VSHRLIYRCSPSIIWVKDADQTLVVDQETGRSWFLQGAEAVMWGLLTVGYAYRRVVPMLSLILSLPEEEAERRFVGALRKWLDARLVQVSGEADDGELDRQCGV
jgi:hypothetical protein